MRLIKKDIQHNENKTNCLHFALDCSIQRGAERSAGNEGGLLQTKPMAQLTVRNVSAQLARALKLRAERRDPNLVNQAVSMSVYGKSSPL
jgi:hypothetical protein